SAFMPVDQTRAAVQMELHARERNGDSGGRLRFAQYLTEARRHGLARSVGTAVSARHKVMVNAFSAPVYDEWGNMLLAISTTCEAQRLDPDWRGQVPGTLRRIAQEFSAQFGYAGQAD